MTLEILRGLIVTCAVTSLTFLLSWAMLKAFKDTRLEVSNSADALLQISAVAAIVAALCASAFRVLSLAAY